VSFATTIVWNDPTSALSLETSLAPGALASLVCDASAESRALVISSASSDLIVSETRAAASLALSTPAAAARSYIHRASLKSLGTPNPFSTRFPRLFIASASPSFAAIRK